MFNIWQLSVFSCARRASDHHHQQQQQQQRRSTKLRNISVTLFSPPYENISIHLFIYIFVRGLWISHTSMDNTPRGLLRKLDAYLKLKSSPTSLVHAHLGRWGANIQPQHFGRQQDGGMEGRLAGWMGGWMDVFATYLSAGWRRDGLQQDTGCRFWSGVSGSVCGLCCCPEWSPSIWNQCPGDECRPTGAGGGREGGGGRRSRTTATHSHTEGER